MSEGLAPEDRPVADREPDRLWLLPAALTLEAVFVLLVAPSVAVSHQSSSGAKAVAVLALGLLLLLAAGLARRSVVPGLVLQVGVVATGLVQPAMWVLGTLFAGLVFGSMRLMAARPYRLRGGIADRPRRPD